MESRLWPIFAGGFAKKESSSRSFIWQEARYPFLFFHPTGRLKPTLPPMRCPLCQADNDKVLDSRDAEGGRLIRRRRECQACFHRFTTFERIEARVNLSVVKKDGSRVPYEREKILKGLRIACYKRQVSEVQLEKLVDEVEEELLKRGGKEVPSADIGLMMIDRLKLLDHVAFLRFASVYLNPDRVDVLLEELHRARWNGMGAPAI